MLIHYNKFDRNWLLSRSGSVLVLIAGLMMTDAALADDKVVKFLAGSSASENNTTLTPVQLEDLAGPIALYPDDLIGIILPASTNPVQVVQAERFLERYATDPNLKPDPEWDDSIIALLNYPEVVRLMDSNLDWTVKLGQAVIIQENQLMDAIQRFRRRANAAGNLNSDDKQLVLKQGNTIEIKPANPEVIYVPSYEPDQVIVRNYAPFFNYSSIGYPVYYYPYAPDYRFSTGIFWGVTTAFLINWNTHYIRSYRSNNFRHPYYGSNYYANHFLYGDWRNRRSAYRDGRKSSNQSWGQGYDHGRRTANVTRALPLRQPVQTGPILGSQPQLQRNARSVTGYSSGRVTAAPVTVNRYRRQDLQSRYRDGNKSVTNSATRVWRSKQSSRSTTYTRSLPHIDSSTNSSTPSQSSTGNNSRSSSRTALPTQNNNDNNASRLNLRANTQNSFSSRGNRHKSFRR